MAPPDNAKIVLGVLAVAGVGVVLYLLIKRQRKKSREHDTDGTSDLAHSDVSREKDFDTLSGDGEWQRVDHAPQMGQGEADKKMFSSDVTPAETTPKLPVDEGKVSDRHCENGVSQPETDDSSLLCEGANESNRKEEEEGRKESVAADTDSASVSQQMTPLTSSEVDVRGSVSATEVKEGISSSNVAPEGSLLDPNSSLQAEGLGQGDIKSEGSQLLGGATQRKLDQEEPGNKNGSEKEEETKQKDEATSADEFSYLLESAGLNTGANQKVTEEVSATLKLIGDEEEMSHVQELKETGSVGDDVTSLQSGNVSNGDALSFERINSSDDVQSSEGSEGKNGTGAQNVDFMAEQTFIPPGSLTDSLQSFEHVSGSNTESVLSFEQISESGQSLPFDSINPSMVRASVPDIVGQTGGETSHTAEHTTPNSSLVMVESLDKQNGNIMEQMQETLSSMPEDSSIEVIDPQEKADLETSQQVEEPTMSDPHRAFKMAQSHPQNSAKESHSSKQVDEHASSDVPDPAETSVEESKQEVQPVENEGESAGDRTDEPDAGEEAMDPTEDDLEPDGSPATEDAQDLYESSTTVRRTMSQGESVESFKALGLLPGGSQDFYSSESVASFHTARESNTSGSQMDFYSPISSPGGGSVEGLERLRDVDADAQGTSFDVDTDEELTFDEVKESSESPQDRTPTNTPVIPDYAAGDDDSAKSPAQDSWANDSKDVFSTPTGKLSDSQAGGEGGTPVQSPNFETPQQELNGERSLQQELNGEKSLEQEINGEKSSHPSMTSQGSTVPRPSPSWTLSIDKDKMMTAILQAQSAPDRMEISQLQVLTQMLQLEDRALLNTALESIIRASTFTLNVNILRVCECPKELLHLLEKFTAEVLRDPESAKGGSPNTESLLLNIVRAVTNLTMDLKTQPHLEGSLPLLSDLLLSEGVSEGVTLATLQPLTNLSSTPAYHGHYTRILHQLYGLLDTSHSSALRLQCLKVLVNLSLNADMVPHMLAAKAPECLLDLIDMNCDIELLLRTVTFVANVMAIMQEQALTPSKLPADEKAASPETMFSALFSHDRRDVLRNKVFRLTRHNSEDVCYQASRLYKYITTADISPKTFILLEVLDSDCVL